MFFRRVGGVLCKMNIFNLLISYSLIAETQNELLVIFCYNSYGVFSKSYCCLILFVHSFIYEYVYSFIHKLGTLPYCNLRHFYLYSVCMNFKLKKIFLFWVILVCHRVFLYRIFHFLLLRQCCVCLWVVHHILLSLLVSLTLSCALSLYFLGQNVTICNKEKNCGC